MHVARRDSGESAQAPRRGSPMDARTRLAGPVRGAVALNAVSLAGARPVVSTRGEV